MVRIFAAMSLAGLTAPERPWSTPLHIRMAAKRTALEGIVVQTGQGVHQNVNQCSNDDPATAMIEKNGGPGLT